MTFLYSGNPSSSVHDQVRFLIGDTDPTQGKLQDEEITWLLAEWDQNPYQAAAACADHLAATAASWFTYQADGTSITLSEAQQKYMTMADWLRAQDRRRNRLGGGGPYVGGTDIGDKAMHEADATVVHTDFALGMHDIPEAGQQNGGAQRIDLLGGDGPW